MAFPVAETGRLLLRLRSAAPTAAKPHRLYKPAPLHPPRPHSTTLTHAHPPGSSTISHPSSPGPMLRSLHSFVFGSLYDPSVIGHSISISDHALVQGAFVTSAVEVLLCSLSVALTCIL
ncbi:hypothetical protein PAAG_03884 [Paracoccidioides lutzii Pb01]|uniref:Uncharacterized protein n=1 Tax=Paracoccidioides lutzii (strain ATCC MYA-826 / Pb01) TaxID=502779 RepID=C1GZE0_PARBA|nr:hypothetical protein PAAG_03884 [Paracoccidioides lutzii Pb01]EEH41963.2 hypothetical protein PAAG_03884 [Paracoccidioides lutzii Pb01]